MWYVAHNVHLFLHHFCTVAVLCALAACQLVSGHKLVCLFFAVSLYSSCPGVNLHSFIVVITSGRLSLPGDGVETRYIVIADAMC